MENLRRLGPGGAPGFAIAGFAIALWGALALSTPALATTIDLDFEEPSVGPGGAQEVTAAQYNPDPATGVQIMFFSPAGNPGGSSLAEVHQSDDFGADNQV
ncbi:MAG: hypothetical protein HKP27_03680, partial [Myxococcales bacterium]|nr:hypothetical protein [Myxococcales bacterium]